MAKIKLPGCPPPPLLYRQKRSKAKTGKLPQKAQLFAVLAHDVGKTGNRRTVPEFGECRILELFAFAERNAVSLAKPDCKGGKSEALCHKARHRGSRGALAPIKP